MWGGTSHSTWMDAPRSKCACFQFTVSNCELKRSTDARSLLSGPRRNRGQLRESRCLIEVWKGRLEVTRRYLRRGVIASVVWPRSETEWVVFSRQHTWMIYRAGRHWNLCLHCCHKTLNKDTVQCRQASVIYLLFYGFIFKFESHVAFAQRVSSVSRLKSFLSEQEQHVCCM